jgi:hypothetical protein
LIYITDCLLFISADFNDAIGTPDVPNSTFALGGVLYNIRPIRETMILDDDDDDDDDDNDTTRLCDTLDQINNSREQMNPIYGQSTLDNDKLITSFKGDIVDPKGPSSENACSDFDTNICENKNTSSDNTSSNENDFKAKTKTDACVGKESNSLNNGVLNEKSTDLNEKQTDSRVDENSTKEEDSELFENENESESESVNKINNL